MLFYSCLVSYQLFPSFLAARPRVCRVVTVVVVTVPRRRWVFLGWSKSVCVRPESDSIIQVISFCRSEKRRRKTYSPCDATTHASQRPLLAHGLLTGRTNRIHSHLARLDPLTARSWRKFGSPMLFRVLSEGDPVHNARFVANRHFE